MAFYLIEANLLEEVHDNNSIFDSSLWYQKKAFGVTRNRSKTANAETEVAESRVKRELETRHLASLKIKNSLISNSNEKEDETHEDSASRSLKNEGDDDETEEHYDDMDAEWLREVFQGLDLDGDGRVSAAEVANFLQKLNMDVPLEEMQAAMQSFAAAERDWLNAEEFGSLCKNVLEENAEEEHNEEECEPQNEAVVKAFRVFDRNGDGLISATELGDVLWRLGYLQGRDDSFCRDMIRSVDCNGDGFVDISEFRLLMARGSPFTSPAPSPAPSASSSASSSGSYTTEIL